DYVRNPADRCYFCKTELYDLAREEARARGLSAVVSGTNADELRDYRPGLKAADEHGVVQPLAEAGLTKAEIRELSRELGLPTWDKPQQPCLSSRIPYGTEVTAERLDQLARSEMALRALGLREFRVRYHGEIARIEVADVELSKLVEVRRAAVKAHQAGPTRPCRGAGRRWLLGRLRRRLRKLLRRRLQDEGRPGQSDPLHGHQAVQRRAGASHQKRLDVPQCRSPERRDRAVEQQRG